MAGSRSYQTGRVCGLDESGFLESQKRTSFLHGLQGLCGNSNSDFSSEFWNEKRLFLHVYLSAACTGRVEFGRTCAIRIATSDAASFPCDVANS